MFKTVTLLGSSSGRNAGDAALIASIMNELDHVSGTSLRYDIPTVRPRYIRDSYPNRTHPVGMMPWNGALRMLGLPTAASLMRTDAVVIFDAILFDRALFNPLFNFLSSLYLLLPIASARNIPIIGYNVGVGPVSTPSGRHMLRSVIERMRFCMTRDADSLELLRELGVRNPHIGLGADCALNAPAWNSSRVDEVFHRAGITTEEPVLGININRYLDTWASPSRPSMGREAFLQVYAAALTRVAEQIRVPFVFVTTQDHDVEITGDLMARMPSGVRTVLIDKRQYDHEAIKGILRRLSLLCGMRLHSLIMASAEMTPIVGLSYQPKVTHYFNELNIPDRTLLFDNFSPEALSAHILRGWEDRESLRNGLAVRIPELRLRSGICGRLLDAVQHGTEEWKAAWLRETGTRP